MNSKEPNPDLKRYLSPQSHHKRRSSTSGVTWGNPSFGGLELEFHWKSLESLGASHQLHQQPATTRVYRCAVECHLLPRQLSHGKNQRTASPQRIRRPLTRAQSVKRSANHTLAPVLSSRLLSKGFNRPSGSKGTLKGS